jgi:hypothetical protein
VPPLVSISHSFADRAFVERELVPALEAAGFRTWFAEGRIVTADEWFLRALGTEGGPRA